MPSLLRLLRTSLRPYAGYVVLVVSLLLIQSIANLYLPNLNADIINNGVVQQAQLFVQMALTIFVTAPIMLVGGIILAVREDDTLSAILIVILPLMVAVFAVLMYFAIPLFQSMQKKIDRITEVLREQITGVRVIRAFNRTPYERDRFEAANADLTGTALRVNRIFALALPTLLASLNLPRL